MDFNKTLEKLEEASLKQDAGGTFRKDDLVIPKHIMKKLQDKAIEDFNYNGNTWEVKYSEKNDNIYFHCLTGNCIGKTKAIPAAEINGVLKESEENFLKRFEKFAGKVKTGRMTIKGYPVDVDDSDGTYIEMDAVDKEAAKGLFDELQKAGFKVRKSGKTGLVVESVIKEDVISIDKDMDDNTYAQFMQKIKGKKGITVKWDATSKRATISGADNDLKMAGINESKEYDELVNKYHSLKREYDSTPKTDKRTRGSIQFAIDAAFAKMKKHPDYEKSTGINESDYNDVKYDQGFRDATSGKDPKFPKDKNYMKGFKNGQDDIGEDPSLSQKANKMWA